MKIDKIFRVVAVSDNTNSFGLRQFVMVAKDGEAYKSHCSNQFCPSKGSNVTRMSNKTIDGKERKAWHGSFEMTERLPDAPQEVINEVFNKP